MVESESEAYNTWVQIPDPYFHSSSARHFLEKSGQEPPRGPHSAYAPWSEQRQSAEQRKSKQSPSLLLFKQK